MEYIKGRNLEQYVEYEKILSEAEALNYTQQIGEALIYIHQQGFLHRDVKPANIMLSEDNSRAVLVDFGLVREFSQGKSKTHTTYKTDGFAPIEQYEMRSQRGAYTDVYALAATTPFHFGETITSDLANYYDGNFTYGNEAKGKYREKTTEVGSFPPNGFGLYDMRGNGVEIIGTLTIKVRRMMEVRG